MSVIVTGVRSLVRSLVYKVTTNIEYWMREDLGRQRFFSNAFRALSFNGIDGDYVEFGCNSGLTFSIAYHESLRHGHQLRLWAFDSFRGLPASETEQDHHPQWLEHNMSTPLEQFHKLCRARGVPRNSYEVVPGFYKDSLSAMSSTEGPTNIAIAYIDCDLHSSTRDVLNFLRARLKHGMIIAFDDYFCCSSGQISGERMAMLEFLSQEKRWDFIPYMQYCWGGLSFVVESNALKGRLNP